MRSHSEEPDRLGLGQIVGPVVYYPTGSYTILIRFSAAARGKVISSYRPAGADQLVLPSCISKGGEVAET